MTIGQKAAVSLLASTLLAAGFAALAYSGLFSVIETRFFDERVKRSVDASMDGLSSSADAYHSANVSRFSSILEKDYVRRSFLPNQSAEDVFDRTKAFGLIAEETTGLLGVRFIDQDGKRVHFSTFVSDVARSDAEKTVYRNYGEAGDEPYADIGVAEGSSVAIDALSVRRAYAYRFPFLDGFGVYRGSAVFYVSFSGLLERLVQDGRVSLGDDVVAVERVGVLLGAPSWGGQELIAKVASFWSSGPNAEPLTVGATEASGSFVLFSRRGEAGLIGRLVPSSWFRMPEALRWLLLSAFFVTVYLALFLILNMKQDRFAAFSTRIKRFQIELLGEYLERKGDIDMDRWRAELESRRGEARERIRKSAGSLAKKRSEDVDALIDKSWDEILAVMTARGERSGTVDMARFEALLKEALSKGSFVIGASQASEVSTRPRSVTAAHVARQASAPVQARSTVPESEQETVEEIEELDELDEIEEAEEPVEVTAVAPQTVEAAEELEELEEAEEVAEIAESDEAVETIEEAAIAEELEAVEEAELSLVEAASAPEAAEPVEELEELEEVFELGSPEEPIERVAAMALSDSEDESDWGSRSAEALALAIDDDDDLPIIPESLGLELVEETDLADVIAYLDKGLSEDQMVSDELVPETDEGMAPLVLESPFDSLPSTSFESLMGSASGSSGSIPAAPEGGVSAQDGEALSSLEELEQFEEFEKLDEQERTSMDEMLEEVEFDLFLSSLDLSDLDGYHDEDGFLELDEASFVPEVQDTRIESDYVSDEADGAISMLSAEDRDRVEELQAVVADDTEVADLVPLSETAYGSFRLGSYIRRADWKSQAVEELPTVGDMDPEDADMEDADDQAPGDVIIMVDGVFTVNKSALRASDSSSGADDEELKTLADSVLSNDGA